MSNTITIDELVNDIIEHLSETDEEYRAITAEKLGAEYQDDEDVLDGIRSVLEDQRPGMIVGFATGIMTARYEYEGDGRVSVHHPDDELNPPSL